MSWLFASGGLCISGALSVLPMNTQGWFPLGWTGLISLRSKGLSRVFSSTTVWKHQLFSTQSSYGPTLASICDYWKNHVFDSTDLCQQSHVFAFYTLSFHSFSSKKQASFNFMATVTFHCDLVAQENTICYYFHFSLLFAMKWWDWIPWSLVFES